MMNDYSIRSVMEIDLPMILEWRNQPNVRRYMFTQHEITLAEHRNWFSKVSNDKTKAQLLVEDSFGPLGFVQFSSVAKNGIADWGFYAKPNAVKGTGKKLCRAALNHAFDSLNLHKVCGQAIDINTVSIALHKRLGFCQEGFLKEQVLINGSYHGLFYFGLLKQDWHAKFFDRSNDV